MMTTDRCDVHEVHPEKVQEAKRKLLSDEMYASLAQTFSALGDSNRAKIIYSLMDGELCVAWHRRSALWAIPTGQR